MLPIGSLVSFFASMVGHRNKTCWMKIACRKYNPQDTWDKTNRTGRIYEPDVIDFILYAALSLMWCLYS